MTAASDRLIVALDVPHAVAGLELAAKLGNAVSFYKIGLGMLTGIHCAADGCPPRVAHVRDPCFQKT